MRHFDAMRLVPELIAIARHAGESMLAVYSGGYEYIRIKADQSPVTLADLAAHKCIVNGLAKLLPQYPVVSEEDETSLRHRKSGGCFWLIDPLDGTKEFIAGNNEFTVNIALIDQGRPILGLVYAPALDQLYWGGFGLNAYRVSHKETAVIHVRPHASSGVCRVVASKSHLNSETQSFINRLGQVTLVQAGSSLKFCRVAEGLADIYPRLAPTCEWDTAAAQAVLEGAGGAVVTLEGEPLQYAKSDILNPSFIATRSLDLIPS